VGKSRTAPAKIERFARLAKIGISYRAIRKEVYLNGEGLGEWRGGVAPPRSRRTVREPRSSYGSHCRATPRTQLPVSKELWIAMRKAPQPLLGSAKPVLQLLVFPRRPPDEHAVEVPVSTKNSVN